MQNGHLERASGPQLGRTYSPVGCLYVPVTGVFSSTERDMLESFHAAVSKSRLGLCLS